MSLSLYYHTIKYLKLRQIFYQLLFAFKKVFRQYFNYNKYEKDILSFRNVKYSPYIDETQLIDKNIFTFLNITHDFKNTIDWNISQYGKLWNYHLQYLDFLIDDNVSPEVSNLLLKNISSAIINRNLQLESYPVSLRLINSIVFINKFQIRDPVIDLAIKQQVHFLENNLEYHIDANHLFENIIALHFCALFLNQEALIRSSTQLLTQILSIQIYSDGGHYERSPMYHLILMNRLCILLGTMTEQDSNYKNLESVLLRMWSWISHITNQGKLCPLLQDSTGNYLKYYSSIQNFLTTKNLNFNTLELKDSRYRILKNSNFHLIMNCGNAHPEYQPGHAHSDELGIVLYNIDRPVFVDTGVSTYEANLIRLQERSSMSHNTIVLNNKNHSEVWSSFRLARRSRVKIVIDDVDELEVELNPYHAIDSKISRKIILSNNEIEFIDQLSSVQYNLAKAFFHLDFKANLLVIDNLKKICIDNINVNFENAISVSIENYQQALDFNKKVESKLLVVEFKNKLVTRINV